MRTLTVPPSKSITHRVLVCAALARGKSVIQNPLVCDDTLATVNVLEALGIGVQKEKTRWIVEGGAFQTPSLPLDCNESGTTYRFFTAITSALNIPSEITGKPSLLKRPMDDRLTSQLLSGRLLAAPLLPHESVIELAAPPVSKPYVALTLDIQKKFGVAVETENNFCRFRVKPQAYQPTALTMEGDWSSAAVLLAAGVLKNGVALQGVNPNSLQGDRVIVDVLKEMGAKVFWEGDRLAAEPARLHAVNWDLSETPDLYPIVAVLNHLAKGKGRLTGLERLHYKESDRLTGMEKILRNSGCLAPTVIDSTDHRITMAAAALGKARGVEMKFAHPECVAKSWPGFWEAFASL